MTGLLAATKALVLAAAGVAALAAGLTLAQTPPAEAARQPAAGQPGPAAPQPAPRPAPAAAEPAWKVAFRTAYGLKDGEAVRRVAPPYPPCRAEYFKEHAREHYARSKTVPPPAVLSRDYSQDFTKFAWKDGWPVADLMYRVTPVEPEDGITLRQLLPITTGLSLTAVEGEADLLARRATGDFVVQAGAAPEQVAAGLEKILRKECDLKVTLAVKEVERDVYVLSGKYDAKPLPERKKHQIEVFASDLATRNEGGGGSGSLEKMASDVGDFVNARVAVGKVEGAPPRVEWHFNARSPATEVERAQDTDPDAVLRNVAAQTGLTVRLERRKTKVLVVK